MTLQEMFDKAYIGLASQEFKKCLGSWTVESKGICVYSDGNGKHCAWGWVDMSLDKNVIGLVNDLKNWRIGIAATLDEEQLDFASKLQIAHDKSDNQQDMKNNLKKLADEYKLLVPILLERKR